MGKKDCGNYMFTKKLGTYYNPDVATIFFGEGCDGFTGQSETRERREGARAFGVPFSCWHSGGSLVKIPELQLYHPWKLT